MQKTIMNLIPKALYELIQEQIKVINNLDYDEIYLFPSDKEKEYLDLVNERSVAIRHELAQRTRHQLRTVPTLTFFLDDSLDYIENIDNLLK